MKWSTNEILEEKHFEGTFIFPNDLDFLNEVTNCQFFCDVFNEMIQKRKKGATTKDNIDSGINIHKRHKTDAQSKLGGKLCGFSKVNNIK